MQLNEKQRIPNYCMVNQKKRVDRHAPKISEFDIIDSENFGLRLLCLFGLFLLWRLKNPEQSFILPAFGSQPLSL